MSPPQCVCGRVRRRVREHGQDEALGVPERVAVVARARQALGGDRSLLGAGSGLERVEEPEPHGQLKLGVAVDLDVRAAPEIVEVGALSVDEALPPGVPCLSQRPHDLVAERRVRTPRGPGIGDELDDAQTLPGRKVGCDRHTCVIPEALHRGVRPGRPVDDVIHSRRQPELAVARRVGKDCANVVLEGLVGQQRRLERGSGAWIGGAGRRGLVRHETGLHDHAQRSLERLDLVEDGGHGSLHEGDEPRGGHSHRGAGRRPPLHAAP